VSGTVTITQIGSSVKLAVPVVVCLYDGTDIKPGDNLVFSSPANPFPGSTFVRTSSQFKIVDGGWRGGDVFFGGSPTVSSNATAIIVWLGRPGQSGGRLYSMSFDQPDNVDSGIHGYAIGLKDASSSGGTVRFGGPGSDMDNNNTYLGGSGNYKGSGGVKASAAGRYGFEQTQGMLAYNFLHGNSNHFGIVHYLHNCDRSGSNGNYSTAVGESFAILGMSLWAEYLDAVAVITVGGGQTGASLSFDKEQVSVAVGSTVTNTLTKVPSDATVAFTSSNTAVATVASSGTVTGVARGKAVITATDATNGTSESYEVIVK
jgi:uncharacterized protein YjdB